MTYKEYEQGTSLTVNNATKEQLKSLVCDRDRIILGLRKELDEKNKVLDEEMSFMTALMGFLIENDKNLLEKFKEQYKKEKTKCCI